MIRLLLSLLILLPAPAFADEARLSVVVFEGGQPLAGVALEIDGNELVRSDRDGAAQARLPSGERRLLLRRGSEAVLSLDLSVVENESLQLIVTLRADAGPEYLLESSHGGSLSSAQVQAALPGVPGMLRGRVTSVEDGSPVRGARIFVSGTPLDITSDEDGAFSASIPEGSYALSVIANDFATLTIDGIVIEGAAETVRDIELSPAGLELPEFIVLEPYIEGSLAAFVEERRTSSAVTDILGAEQISRAGDSDAAGALRRVTGLTLVDGKFIYVRGLGERYSSVIVNGASIPSPDPTRRVIPLDLFPTDILQGVVIQKTFSPEMPGEFGGGTIQLRTRTFPDEFLLRVGVSGTWADGTSLSDGLRYDGGNRDWTGRDRSTRILPPILAEQLQGGRPVGGTSSELASFGQALTAASSYGVREDSLTPNAGLNAALGNSWAFGEQWRAGFIASLRYNHTWDNRRDERRTTYATSNQGLEATDQLEYDTTDRGIEGSAFLSGGVEFADSHRVRATSMLLRQTRDRVQVRTGIEDNQTLQRYVLEWEENSLLSHQLNGEHDLQELLPWLGIGVDWSYTDAKARRYAPNTRQYRLDDDAGTGRFRLSQRSDSNSQSFADLDDDSQQWTLAVERPFALGESSSLRLSVGTSRLQRERDSDVRRFGFRIPGLPASQLEFFFLPIDEQLRPENIGPNGFVFRDGTRGTDAYRAEQTLDAHYFNFDLNLFDRLRLVAGVRREDFVQDVNTFNVFNPNVSIRSLLESKDTLPAFAATWWISESQQLRLGYGRTVSRPDFREVTQDSPFVDPLLDILTIGNPELLDTGIKHLDLRWETYFSPTESLSVALFRKDFENPIEQVQRAGSGTLLSFENALAATSQGIEIDVFKQLGFLDRWLADRAWSNRLRLDRPTWSNFFVAANYARIDSDIQLDPERNQFQTNDERPMQGQSPYVANLQFGYQDPEATREVTLLYNVFGRRIVNVGVQGQPDVYEEPFRQLDLVYNQKWRHGLTFKVRLRNLLDSEARFTQGDLPTRLYRKGREVSLGVDWSF